MQREIFWAAFGGALAAGLVTMVALLAAEWFRWYIDRPLIKVSASLGRAYGGQFESGERHLYLEARNPHSRPVTVSSFGLLYRESRRGWRLRGRPGRLWFRPNDVSRFPNTIDGGQSLTQWHTVDGHLDRLREIGLEPRNMRKVWFLSSAGKYYQEPIDKEVIKSLQTQFGLTQKEPS